MNENSENPQNQPYAERLFFKVEEKHAGMRLDVFLAARITGISRSRIKRLIEAEAVTVGDSREKAGYRLSTGDKITVEMISLDPSDFLKPEKRDLDIVYEDADVIVVNKPAGMVVHPAAGHWDKTLVQGLLYHTELTGGDDERPGIVHRIDMDTSGLIVVAKNPVAHESLSSQFHEHSTGRRYLALVRGHAPDSGKISGMISRHPVDRKRFSGKTGRGKHAVTRYKTLEKYVVGASLVELELETGRTHQIRVHMSEAGHPLLGDPVYGGRKVSSELKPVVALLPGQALHAASLSFTHPANDKKMEFEAPPPDSFQKALDSLRETGIL